MVSRLSNEFLTIRAWHRAIVGGTDMILRNTSALEHLQLFLGYDNERKIDVYAKCRGEYENIDYCIVDSYDNIDVVRFDNVLCTSVSQTINDMLSNFDNIDEQALVTALSNYYFSHGESFDGLILKPENMARFNTIKDWAIGYYDED